MKVWTYLPDQWVDLGAAGEHPAEFIAWIDVDYEGGLQRRSVNITKVTVKITFGSLVQELDITYKILNSPYTLSEWEEEIWQDYQQSKNKEFRDDDEVVA